MTGDEGQHTELTRLYGEFGDRELLDFGSKMADLTEVAQEALKGEISRRGLSVETIPAAAAPDSLTTREASELWTYAALAPQACVFEFEESDAAREASQSLTDAGIRSVAVPETGPEFERHGPRVVVTPEDAERAALLLSQPLAGRFKGGREAMMASEFEEPACPACGRNELVLEAVEPVNQWRCDICGELWVEHDQLPEA